MIKYLDVKAHSGGMTKLTLVIDKPPSSFSDILHAFNSGKPFLCDIKPYKKSKTTEQLAAIWGKIGEIAGAIGASNEEVYELMLRRYGKVHAARVEQKDLEDYYREYRIVDVKEMRDSDKTAFIKAWKGLSKMTTDEAKILLDGILSECKEIGLDAEVR